MKSEPIYYSDFPNNRVANLIGKKFTYTLTLRPTHSSISEIFTSKLKFGLLK